MEYESQRIDVIHKRVNNFTFHCFVDPCKRNRPIRFSPGYQNFKPTSPFGSWESHPFSQSWKPLARGESVTYLDICLNSSINRIEWKFSDWIHMYLSTFLCRLRSIATQRDHFVHRLSVRLSHFSVTLSKAMFRRRHMHSSECCHYFFSSCL